jgi:hypothetical protein
MLERNERRSRRAFVSVAAAFSLACAQAKEVGLEAGRELNPFGSREATVMRLERHGPYLLAELSGRRANLSMLVPADAICAQVLEVESQVRFRRHGNFGRFERGDAFCDAVGVASLAAWRDRRPRAPGPPVPRATVRFRLLERDPELVLVRGRFPLASRVGIPAGFDLVALLPANDDNCARAIERGEGSMEFRAAGPQPFRLVGERGTCPVLGFAQPLESSAP